MTADITTFAESELSDEFKMLPVHSQLRGCWATIVGVTPGDRALKGMAAPRGVLCLQIPSWEINPFIPAAFYESVHADDPRWFWQEYGAEFTNPGVGP